MNRLWIALCLCIAVAQALPRLTLRHNPGRIVGGEDAEPGEIPWQASLQTRTNFLFCGASVISASWIISAAHCVVDETTNSVKVIAGDWNTARNDGTEQTGNPAELIPHPNYRPLLSQNDISLIRLQSPLTLNEFVTPIALPRSSFQGSGNALVSGWGNLRWQGNTPDVLQKAIVPIVSDADCAVSYPGIMVDSLICAGYDEGGVDSCQGDSGGPLVCGDVLCGVVCTGNECALAGYPGVYTEVSYFVDWITSESGVSQK